MIKVGYVIRNAHADTIVYGTNAVKCLVKCRVTKVIKHPPIIEWLEMWLPLLSKNGNQTLTAIDEDDDSVSIGRWLMGEKENQTAAEHGYHLVGIVSVDGQEEDEDDDE